MRGGGNANTLLTIEADPRLRRSLARYAILTLTTSPPGMLCRARTVIRSERWPLDRRMRGLATFDMHERATQLLPRVSADLARQLLLIGVSLVGCGLATRS